MVATVRMADKKDKLNITTVNKRRASRENFGTGLFADSIDLADKVLDVIEQKGRIYGIYKGKELVGIYVYDRNDDFFVMVENVGISEQRASEVKGNKRQEIFSMTNKEEDILFGENKAVYSLTLQYLSDDAAGVKDKIEEYIRADLKEQVEWGQIAGILWGEELLYRKNVANKGISMNTAGRSMGFVLGMIFGWIVFDNIGLGILWGISFASVGGLIATGSATKAEWAAFDFVNETQKSNDTDTCHNKEQ